MSRDEAGEGRPWRKGAPPATPEPERSGIRAGTRTLAGAEPEREPELEPKLEPAVRRTERSEAAKPSKGRGAGGGAGEGRGGCESKEVHQLSLHTLKRHFQISHLRTSLLV